MLIFWPKCATSPMTIKNKSKYYVISRFSRSCSLICNKFCYDKTIPSEVTMILSHPCLSASMQSYSKKKAWHLFLYKFKDGARLPIPAQKTAI